MVQMMDEELTEVWDRIYLTARRTFSEEGIPETKEVF